MAATIFLAVCGTAAGLAGVLRGGTWFLFIMFTTGTVLAAMAVARTLRVPNGWVSAIGTVALVLQLTLVFFPGTAILGIIPTPASLEQLPELLRQASDTVVRDVAPVQAGSGVLFVVCLGVGLVTLLVDALAVGLLMPAISGIGLLVIALIPASIKPDSLGVTGFVLGAAGYLAIIALSNWYVGGRRPGRARGELWRVGVIGAGAIVLALVLAMITPGFSTGTFPQGSRLTPFGQVAGLSPFISLGKDLRDPSSAGRIDYATSAASPPYLRTLTIENFDGENWAPTDRSSDVTIGTEQIQNDFAATAVALQSVTTQINPAQFSSEWLPIPYAPTEITGLAGRWSWDPKNLVVKALDQDTLGQNYTVKSVTPVLTPEVLRSAITPPRPSLDPIFMSLPPNMPPVIRETALAITGQSPTNYDKAMALQQYLRSSNFTYSLQAPVSGGYDGSSMDTLAKFLAVKSGYCVHFSATMAVLAREAGIPSRIGVGFAPGSPTGKTVDVGGQELNQYFVDGRAAHAWPELYFEGLGWVPFEPTPSRGQVPSYAQPPPAPGTSENPSLEPEPLPSTPPVPGQGAPPPSSGTASSASSWNPLWLLIPLGILAVLVLLTLPGAARTSLRRFRLSGGSTPANAWAELRETALDVGMLPVASDTPRRFAQRLADSDLAGSPGLELSALVGAFERSSYGPPDRAQTLRDDGLELAQTRIAVAALQANASGTQKLRSMVLPPSTLKRWALAVATLIRRWRRELAKQAKRVASRLGRLVRRRRG